MPPNLPDIAKLAAALETENVRCVLIGGMAMMVHGSTHVTTDLDLAIAYDPETVGSLTRALAPFHPVPDHLPEGTEIVWDERSIRPHPMYFRTDIGTLDILMDVPGIENFEDFYNRSPQIQIASSWIRVASLDDLLAMKNASKREKDRSHLKELEELKRIASDNRTS